MPEVELIELFSKSEDLSDLTPFVLAELESGDVSLLKAVEVLGPWLTDPDKNKRVQGTSLLAAVLRLIPSGFLLETECYFMVTFFCDRLRDHYTVIPYALSGLDALSLMDNFPDDSIMEIISSLQENVTCQSLTHQQRYVFYSIMNSLFIKKNKLISTKFPTEYMYALISGMDSESDPRNLLFLFSFLPKVLAEIPLKHLTEEAFAVLECYFPVDFRPVEEKGNITREDLAKGLEACLTSNSAFIQYCIPMICEKMESSLKIAQMDSLNLIITGCKNWDIELVNPFINKLWFCIKDVLITGNDQEVSSLASRALISLVTAFSTGVLSENETKSLTFVLENILSSTHGYLSNPGLSLFLPTLKLLSDVITTSSTAAGFILPRILPQLLALVETNLEQKDIILRALSPILDSSVKFNCWEIGTCDEQLRKVLPVVLNSIEDDKCRGSAFLCLTAIISKIPDDIRLSLYRKIPNIVCSDTFLSCSEELAQLVRTLSEHYSEEIEIYFISTFKIPDELSSKDAMNYLKVLTWTIDFPQLTEASARVILKHILDNEHDVWKNVAVLVLRDYVGRADTKLLKSLGSQCNFPKELLQLYFNKPIGKEDEIECVAAILTNIIQVLDVGEQKSVLTIGLELFNRSISSNDSSSTQLVLLEGLACALKRDVDIKNFHMLFESLLEYSISAHTSIAKTSAARLLAVFLNKINDENEMDSLLKLAKLKIQSNPCFSSVRLSAWITKSLILKGYSPVCDEWLVELLNLVSDVEFGMVAADCVRLLLEDCSFLSEANHCNVGLLFKQRIFQKFGLLLQNGKPSNSVCLALSYILKYSPISLVHGVLDQLTGVMVYCLESDDSAITLSVLEILSSFLGSCVDILSTLAETFIPRCISLAQTSPYMAIRQEALNCIYHYGKYSAVDMLPYKKIVLTGLQKCLDDKKRLVRACAVKARTRWFLV